MNASLTTTTATDTATDTQENIMTDEKIFNSIYSLTLDRNLKELKKLQGEIGRDKFNEITRRLTYNDDMIAESLKWGTKHWKESPAEKIAKFEAMDAEFKTPETLEEAIQIAERFTEWENLKGLKILKDTVGEEMWSGVVKEINDTAWLYGDKIEHLTEYWGKIDHTKKENTMTAHTENNQDDTTTQKENTMNTSQNKECLKNLEWDREADDDLCQGEERAKLAESFGDWNLMVKGGEYFFQHQDPDYSTGKMTMLEPGIVDGRAEAILQESNLEYFQGIMPDDDDQVNEIIEDNYKINKLVSRANRWLRSYSPSLISNQGEEMKPQDADSQHEDLQEEHTMETQSENYEAKYAEECGPDSIVIGSYIDELVEDFFERGYDEIDNRIRYMIDSADAESLRVFVRELGIGYPVDMFVNDMTKDAKYIQDHSRCGEECIVPKSKRIALANADETSQEFQMMF